MGIVDNEVAFLKNFRKRFPSFIDYKRALKDMRDEGLITKAAYNRVVGPAKKETSPKRSLDRSSCGSAKPRKRVTERVRIVDSCGGNASWSSSC